MKNIFKLNWLISGVLFVVGAVMPGTALGDVEGMYIKDERQLDEIGFKATLQVSPLDNGRFGLQVIAANPALCGGALQGETEVVDNRGALKDEDCVYELTFQENRIQVSRTGTVECFGAQCSLAGTYLKYGALVKPEKEMIQNIRDQYAHINGSLESYDLLTPAAETGETVKAWQYMEWVKKIVVDRRVEGGSVHEEFYYWDNDLIFCFRSSETAEGSGKPIEDRFYFHQGNMIRWLDRDRKTVAPGSPDFVRAAGDVQAMSVKWMELAVP